MVRDEISGKMLELVRPALQTTGKSAEELANDIGYQDGGPLQLLLNGMTKFPLNKVRQLASAIGIDTVVVLSAWLSDYHPELIAFDEVMLVSDDERRLIEKVRAHYQGADAKLVVVDGRDLVAVVLGG